MTDKERIAALEAEVKRLNNQLAAANAKLAKRGERVPSPSEFRPFAPRKRETILDEFMEAFDMERPDGPKGARR